MLFVAISGSQGAGKTTLLNELSYIGYPTIDRKTSRSLQKDWGYKLEDINADKQLTMLFQEELLRRKIADEQKALTDRPDGVLLNERTYADVFTYALTVLGKEPSCSQFLDEYYEKCFEAQKIYHKVFYLTAGHFLAEVDPHRASMNKHYQRLIDNTMLDLTKQLTDPSKLVIIDTPDLQQRKRIVLENLT